MHLVYNAATKQIKFHRFVAQVAASMVPDSAAVVTRNVVTLITISYLNVVDSKRLNDGRLKIGGAIRLSQNKGWTRTCHAEQWLLPTSMCFELLIMIMRNN